MPLVGYEKECKCPADFKIRNGSGKKVDAVELDHYARVCANPHIPRTLAYALYHATQRERYGQDNPVVSTTGLTACPLATYFQLREDFVEKVLDGRWRLRGTFAHEGILSTLENDEDWIIEQPLVYDADTHIGKVQVFGTFDAFFKPEGALKDLKTQREYALKLKNEKTDEELGKDAFVRDNMTQLNVYRVMIEDGAELDREYNVVGPLGLTVKSAELQYMDGGLRMRLLPVELKPKETIIDFINRRAALMQQVIDGALKVGEIPARKWEGFNPVKNSGIWYRVKEALATRAA